MGLPCVGFRNFNIHGHVIDRHVFLVERLVQLEEGIQLFLTAASQYCCLIALLEVDSLSVLEMNTQFLDRWVLFGNAEPVKPGSCFTGSNTPHVLVVIYLIPRRSALNLSGYHGSVRALGCVLVDVLGPQDGCTLLHVDVALESEEEQRVVGNNHTVVSSVGDSLPL